MSAIPVRWLGICDTCGAASPESRDSKEEAEQDGVECEHPVGHDLCDHYEGYCGAQS